MEKKTQKGDKPDPESLTNSPGRPKKPLSTGKYLKDDPGWLGPFNSMVWQFPNSMLYITLVVGLCVYYALRQKGYSTSPFIGAAVVEVLLSTDNICLFHQIFEHFRVPREIGPASCSSEPRSWCSSAVCCSSRSRASMITSSP